MVFRGRPSTACFACRGRRIKCDRKQLGCGQCARMSIPCPLYPDPLVQAYRDQSDITIRKAEESYQRKARRVAYSGSNAMIGALCYNPSLHLDTIALTEFLASYVPQSPYDYLSAIYRDQSLEAPLVLIIWTVSLAMSAWKLKDPRVLATARQLYATALSVTNNALRDPNTAAQDSTLVSVLLLGLFEALACQVSGKSSNWTKHTRGALALLRVRGQMQFSTKLGRRLFDQICSILTFDTMVRKSPLPPDLLQLVSTAKASRHESTRTAFVMLVGEITQAPCVLWDLDMLPIAKVEKALWLDQRVSEFTKELPPDYEYQKIRKEAKETPISGWDAHSHVIHQYLHHHAARLWNACRVLRIKLNSVIYGTLSQLPPSALSTFEEGRKILRRATQTISEAATDICASVPQILNPAQYDQVGIKASHEARIATLLPALSVTKAETMVPQTARSYAADRLKYMGKEFLIPQAESAAASVMGLDVLHSGFHMLYVY
ncbi:hypothetical protein BU23DRAFT_511224 [Bimuria novae-zelandiae CBS 107.79]|uniref:Zn(2)-C6 fungal-type domain-containing protein n=1 Tax=Bimuria novae-zelandiae CBS 107.79 TaxID=1447943 RepID=A0A6A5VBQ2_9PLEO|nr:hypothetical protein BU23DRAFT_511224 [Bimuria novae-zelandiae CBS 107.79]